MKYYRVKEEFDNTTVYKNQCFYGILIGGELYTEHEVFDKFRSGVTVFDARYCDSKNKIVTNDFCKLVDVIDVSKRNTYFAFGARFAD